MYHKSADSWYIGTENGDFEPENESDVPRKREILVHHFFYREISRKPSRKIGKNHLCYRFGTYSGKTYDFSGHYNAKNPSK